MTLLCCLLCCNFLDISRCILCMMYQFSFVHLSMKILWCFCKLISMCYCSLLLFLNFFCVVCSCIPFISLLIIVEQRKSNEAEVESLREEYHQRVATLERKVSLFVNLICFLCLIISNLTKMHKPKIVYSVFSLYNEFLADYFSIESNLGHK